MGLNPISTGLRTIHNGSNSVAKASVNVPAGGELTVPEVVAAQLQRDSQAFKDGPPTAELLAAIAAQQPELADDSPVKGTVETTDEEPVAGVQGNDDGAPPVVVKPRPPVKKPAPKKD